MARDAKQKLRERSIGENPLTDAIAQSWYATIRSCQ